MKSILKYPGAKNRLASWICEYIPKSFTLDQEILVDFDDSYITDREAELERKRNDALSFDIPELTIWYLMEAYSLTEDEAKKLVKEKLQEEEEQPTGEDED